MVMVYLYFAMLLLFSIWQQGKMSSVQGMYLWVFSEEMGSHVQYGHPH